jgi:hypothetical protein
MLRNNDQESFITYLYSHTAKYIGTDTNNHMIITQEYLQYIQTGG